MAYKNGWINRIKAGLLKLSVNSDKYPVKNTGIVFYFTSFKVTVKSSGEFAGILLFAKFWYA